MLKIAVTLRVVENATYEERRDAISHDWIRYLERHNICPLLVPNSITSVPLFLNTIGGVDGILLTGGNSVGVKDSRDNAKERDRLEWDLIKFAEENDLPLLGVCRGMQVLNCYYGGRVVSFISQNGKGNHVNNTHSVSLSRAKIELPEEWQNTIVVNSYHDHGVTLDSLAPALIPFAITKQGVVEGIKHNSRPFWAVQWHPERERHLKCVDTWLINQLRTL